MTPYRLAFAGFLIGTLALGAALAADPAPDSGRAELLKAQAATARRTYEMILAEARGGKLSADDLVEQGQRWSRHWMKAEMDLATTKEQKTAAIEAHLARIKQVEDRAKGFVRSGQAQARTATAAEFYRLDAEVLLADQKPAAKGEKLPEKGEKPAVVPVKTVRPLPARDHPLRVRAPAVVAAYARVDLQSRVAGGVKSITVDVGSRVKKGQLLIEIDAPELVQAVRARKVLVEQRRLALERAEANLLLTETAVTAAKNEVDMKAAALKAAEATEKYRELQLQRLRELWKRQTIEKTVVDEAEKQYEAVRAGTVAARADLQAARLRVQLAEANVMTAKVEVGLARNRVEAAQVDLEAAQTLLDFTSLRAPFDGVVARRGVDPGSFVRGVAAGRAEPLLTLERLDLVTVGARVPAKCAPYVVPGADMAIAPDALPGVVLHAKVSRVAPSLQDGAFRVEADLWNDSKEKYEAFLEKVNKGNSQDLKEGPQTVLPEVTGRKAGDGVRLLPDMFVLATVELSRVGGGRLLPSQAVVGHEGRPCIWVVRDGKAHALPVEVEIDDGRLARVALIGADPAARGELTGSEEVIVTNQEELSEGQPVLATPVPGR